MKTGTSLAALVAASAAGLAGAADFAPPGAKATLAVEYRYESSGKAAGSGGARFERFEWQPKRSE